MTIYKTPLRSIENLTFAVVEFCDSQVLLQREQHYLDILFSLPATLRYNFHPTAGSPLGYKHTEESRALMSEVKSGENNPMFGRTHTPETLALMSEVFEGLNIFRLEYVTTPQIPEPIVICMGKFLLMLF